MNIITHPRGEVGTVVVFSRHRIQIPPDDGWGAYRAANVADAAVRAVMDIESFCCLTAATHHACEWLQRVSNLTRRPAHAFLPNARDLAALKHARHLVGTNYPGAAWLNALCGIVPCEPSADEVAQGLCEALHWALTPAEIVRFGFSADQGWRQ